MVVPRPRKSDVLDLLLQSHAIVGIEFLLSQDIIDM
jgi:hypothetical protein